MAEVQTVAIIRGFSNEDGGDDFAMSFDAVIRESHSLKSTVTSHPVATGVSIADHMYDEPDRLSIDAAVSDIPSWSALNSQNPDLDDWASTSRSRSQEAFYRLDQLRRRHEPFKVQTGLRLYRNMVITDLQTEQDKGTAAILSFKAELTEVKIVETRTVTYQPRKAGKTKRQADAVADAGKKESPKPKDEAAAIVMLEKTKSDAASLVDKLLGKDTVKQFGNVNVRAVSGAERMPP
jgi:hypothetical protein